MGEGPLDLVAQLQVEAFDQYEQLGSMAARLVALCGMEALAVAAGFSLKVLWLTDAPVHAAPFSSLFSLPAHPKISKPDLRWAVEDVSPECVAGPLLRSPPHGFKYKAASVGDFDCPILPFPLRAHHVRDPCWMADELAACLHLLHPSPAVARLLADEDIPRVQRSTAAFLEHTRTPLWTPAPAVPPTSPRSSRPSPTLPLSSSRPEPSYLLHLPSLPILRANLPSFHDPYPPCPPFLPCFSSLEPSFLPSPPPLVPATSRTKLVPGEPGGMQQMHGQTHEGDAAA
ncbi:unnamed protein product [Closterium sp. Naga37s-1]|nr:unnamed protein product [Closterium sp. Naga37s-1]